MPWASSGAATAELERLDIAVQAGGRGHDEEPGAASALDGVELLVWEPAVGTWKGLATGDHGPPRCELWKIETGASSSRKSSTSQLTIKWPSLSSVPWSVEVTRADGLLVSTPIQKSG